MNLGEPDFGSLEFSMADQMFWPSSQGAEIEEDIEGGEITDISHHRHHQLFLDRERKIVAYFAHFVANLRTMYCVQA